MCKCVVTFNVKSASHSVVVCAKLRRCRLYVVLWILVVSSPPSAACMRLWTGSALVPVMACRLFGAKPLPAPMLVYCQLDSWEQISVNFESKFYNFHPGKCIWNCRLPKWRPFCPGGDELKQRKNKDTFFFFYIWHALCILSNILYTSYPVEHHCKHRALTWWYCLYAKMVTVSKDIINACECMWVYIRHFTNMLLNLNLQWDSKVKHRQTSNIGHTLVDNNIVDHSYVVGASPVGAAPTTSSLST